MEKHFVLASARQTRALGQVIGQAAGQRTLIALVGPLGAGKTALVQGAGAGLGVLEPVVSPTFTMLNEYHSGRLPLYHFDLYRLAAGAPAEAKADSRMLELVACELHELTQAEAVVMIEWAEIIRSSLPGDHLLIEIDYLPDNEGRKIFISACGNRSTRLMQDINCSFIST